MPKTDTFFNTSPWVLFTHEDRCLDLLPYVFVESVRISSFSSSISIQSETFVRKEVTLLLILLLATGCLIFSPYLVSNCFYAYDSQFWHILKEFLRTSLPMFSPTLSGRL